MATLSMCNIIAESCVHDAQEITKQSEKIVENIIEINQDLNGVFK